MNWEGYSLVRAVLEDMIAWLYVVQFYAEKFGVGCKPQHRAIRVNGSGCTEIQGGGVARWEKMEKCFPHFIRCDPDRVYSEWRDVNYSGREFWV